MRNLIILVILYVLIGVGINVAQEQTGVPCKPGDIHEVDVDEPKGLMKYIYWAPNLYQQVVERQVPWEEYFSPTSCVDDPNPEPEPGLGDT